MIEIIEMAVLLIAGWTIARYAMRTLGYDQWFYQRLYDRDKHEMCKSDRKHMRDKFGVHP